MYEVKVLARKLWTMVEGNTFDGVKYSLVEAINHKCKYLDIYWILIVINYYIYLFNQVFGKPLMLINVWNLINSETN